MRCVCVCVIIIIISRSCAHTSSWLPEAHTDLPELKLSLTFFVRPARVCTLPPENTSLYFCAYYVFLAKGWWEDTHTHSWTCRLFEKSQRFLTCNHLCAVRSWSSQTHCRRRLTHTHVGEEILTKYQDILSWWQLWTRSSRDFTQYWGPTGL